MGSQIPKYDTHVGQGTVLCPVADMSSAAPCDCRFRHAGHARSLTHRHSFFEHRGKDFFLTFRCEQLKSGCIVTAGNAFHDRLCLFVCQSLLSLCYIQQTVLVFLRQICEQIGLSAQHSNCQFGIRWDNPCKRGVVFCGLCSGSYPFFTLTGPCLIFNYSRIPHFIIF